MTTKVMDLSTGNFALYSCDPESAVLAAFAQSRNDGNLTTSRERYGHLLKHGEKTVSCGDFAAFTEAAKNAFLDRMNKKAKEHTRTAGREVRYDYINGNFKYAPPAA